MLSGSNCLLYSKEGATQGDPLSMAFYAIGLLPLIRDLKDLQRWIQVWYADESNCAGRLELGWILLSTKDRSLDTSLSPARVPFWLPPSSYKKPRICLTILEFG